jgi:hypothetical protein
VFDLSYDIDAGRYDLTVRAEGRDESLVEFFDQPNVTAERPDIALRRLWSGELDRTLVDLLKQRYPDAWNLRLASALTAEHRFYVLQWQSRHDEAARYAERVSRRMTDLGLSPGRWIERLGDAP